MVIVALLLDADADGDGDGPSAAAAARLMDAVMLCMYDQLGVNVAWLAICCSSIGQFDGGPANVSNASHQGEAGARHVYVRRIST